MIIEASATKDLYDDLEKTGDTEEHHSEKAQESPTHRPESDSVAVSGEPDFSYGWSGEGRPSPVAVDHFE